MSKERTVLVAMPLRPWLLSPVPENESRGPVKTTLRTPPFTEMLGESDIITTEVADIWGSCQL